MEETNYQLLLARDLKYMEINHYDEIRHLADEVGKLINGTINNITIVIKE